jgi:hypothetical protein
MDERRITIAFPSGISNPTYAALVRGLQGLLHAAGVSRCSTIHPDTHITDAELNAAYREAAAFDPWAP